MNGLSYERTFNLTFSDKANFISLEKKYKLEIEELRSQLKRHQELERRGDRRKFTDEEYARKIDVYEKTFANLRRTADAHESEEKALLNEMDVTGQAFEDMQEQNCRLLQQLKEKDDANFNLMSESIKSKHIQKLLQEEMDVMVDHCKKLEVSF